jgi:alkaline phosphatase D
MLKFGSPLAHSLAAALLGMISLAGCSSDEPEVARALLDRESAFPQSVASGDPRPDSVILWTRVVDPEDPGDLTVTLEVATDRAMEQVFARENLVAKADHDHCVKVRVDDLTSGTHYYYRFTYRNEEGPVRSVVGRTKTALSPTVSETVRWAFFSGQDYVGKYYNSFAHLLATYFDKPGDLDFLVHVGDYVYENTGDPSFQDPGAERGFNFEDLAGAIRRGSGADTFYSAKSLANYRTLYKVYRSDPMLQRLHENYPMIVVWDDHEYSDDCHGATATYFDGRVDETDTVRRRNAERAFFEFMPTEVGVNAAGDLEIDAGILYPNTRIYRSFRFGPNCEIFMTDYRTYRPDHLIPEDAFPGTIVMDQAATEAALGAGGGIEPYLDIDAPANAALKAGYVTIITGLYLLENPDLSPAQAAALAAQAVTGNQSARFLNAVFAGTGQAEPIDLATLAVLPRGIAYLTLGKQALYSSMGARYAVSHDLLAVYGAYRRLFDADVDNALGSTQLAWLQAGMTASNAKWKVLGSSVSAAPMVFNFADKVLQVLLPPEFPDDLKVRLQMNADQWDGFPVAKQELLTFLSRLPDVVVMSGDIHSSWLADHGDRRGLDPAAVHRVYEFTGTSVSSGTIETFIERQVAAIPLLTGVDLSGVIVALPWIFLRSSETAIANQPSRLVYLDPDSNGYVVLEASATSFLGRFHHYPSEYVGESFYEDIPALMDLFEERAYRIENGTLTPIN